MATPEVVMMFDGDCPLCMKEAALLRWLDGGRGRFGLLDITAPSFDPARYGLTHDEVMAEIHGLIPGDGPGDDPRVIRGMEVFRRAYRAVGLNWLLAWTVLPGARQMTDAAYRWFARNRLRLTRRCEDGVCGVPVDQRRANTNAAGHAQRPAA